MNKRAVPPLGSIEPHAPKLSIPRNDQLLYKIMNVENLLRSIDGKYLYFNRVDSYTDFFGADSNDGKQLPQDEQGNAGSGFVKNSNFTAKNYYDQSRSRTYACCFSLENSDYIWNNYGNGGNKGKVCIVINFEKLRTMLNESFPEVIIEYSGVKCYQIFSINYGVVNYVEWDVYQANSEHLPNPIDYTYLKSNNPFIKDNEFRISLSAFGLGQFALQDGSIIEFPSFLQWPFIWQTAIQRGVIQQILLGSGCDTNFLYSELDKLGIGASEGSDVSFKLFQ